MATYKKLTIILEPFQEGNRSDIVIDVDAEKLSLDGIGASCELRDGFGYLIWSKNTADATMSIVGQRVTIPLAPADTKSHRNAKNLEIDFLNAENEPFATIAAAFKIESEINTNG